MLRDVSPKVLRKRRSAAALIALLLLVVFQVVALGGDNPTPETVVEQQVLSESAEGLEIATEVLDTLEVKGRAPKTGYSRSQFGSGWANIDGCDVRNLILARDLTDTEYGSDGCVVLNGLLDDPYTAAEISFVRGKDTSDDVQVDHVVALSDSWQKGAQQLDKSTRTEFANDSLNLLAVDGPANQQKGDSDAASWLPSNKSYRCRYVARQIAVKRKYSLWVTEAEKSAMQRTLNACKDQPLPLTTPASLLPSGARNTASFLATSGLTSPLLSSSYLDTPRSTTPGRTKISSSVESGATVGT